jgi:TonB family protein
MTAMSPAEFLIHPEKELANRRKSAIITAIIFILLLLLAFLWVFKNPEPEFPQSGILIAMGTTEEGSGDTKPQPQEEQPKTQSEPQPEQQPAPQEAEQPVETVDDPNATAVEEEEEQQEQEETKEPEQEKTEPAKEVEEQPKEPEQPKYTLPNETQEEQQTQETKGNYEMPGNMGDPKGDERSNQMGETPGLGNFDFGGGLSGRGVLGVPKVEKKARKEQGKIILEIFVNQDGNVTRVGDILRGTEITDPAMMKEARELASQVRFDPTSSGGTVKGTITITFKY